MIYRSAIRYNISSAWDESDDALRESVRRLASRVGAGCQGTASATWRRRQRGDREATAWHGTLKSALSARHRSVPSGHSPHSLSIASGRATHELWRNNVYKSGDKDAARRPMGNVRHKEWGLRDWRWRDNELKLDGTECRRESVIDT